LGHQKQGLPAIGREVFGSGDAIANLQKNRPTHGTFRQAKRPEQNSSWALRGDTTRPEFVYGNISEIIQIMI